MTPQQKLDELKEATRKSIEQNKKFEFRNKRFVPASARSYYYEKYLCKSNGDNVAPEIVNSDGKRIELKFNIPPNHNKTILLTLAFAKAEKLYSELREYIKVPNEPNKPDADTTGIEDEAIPELSPLEILSLSRYFLNGKNNELKTSIKKNEKKFTNSFLQIEQLLFAALKELRNYHAHIFHEPGPVSFCNLYSDIYKPKTKLSQAEWETARNWFHQQFDGVKTKTIKRLEAMCAKLDTEDGKKEQIEEVIDKLNKKKFFEEENKKIIEGGNITQDALLFIACMFLHKSDADYIVKKWEGAKKTIGAYKHTQDFYKHFTLRDAKSVSPQNENLRNFLKIVSTLSTMPKIPTENMEPFYLFIETHNKAITDEIKRIETNSNERNNKIEIESRRNWHIPIRKNNVSTYWYLNYLQTKGLLSDFKVAYYKSQEEIAQYLKNNNIDEEMAEYKAKMRKATGDEKRHMTEIYKEHKRNFTFKDPSNDYDTNFCIKRENAIFIYELKDNNGKPIADLKLNISSDYLMKWAFADLVWDKGIEIKNRLIGYINKYYYHLMKIAAHYKDPNTVAHPERFEHYGLPEEYLLPPSLINTPDEGQGEDITINRAKRIIDGKIKELESLINESSFKKFDPRFASKRKIDCIFDYAHFAYTSKAFDDKKDVDTRRHEALNDGEYLEAFDKIRFYGRDYETPSFDEFFRKEKKEYFSSIADFINNSNSLESLFDKVSVAYLKKLHLIIANLTPEKLQKCKVVFKISGPSLKSNIGKHAAQFSRNISISPKLINICEMAGDLQQFKDWKNSPTSKNGDWATDYSFIRHALSKGTNTYSNTDYLMKQIMPVLLKKGLLAQKEAGTIKGGQAILFALLENKTKELMLWEIAKYFWKQHTGKQDIPSSSTSPLNKNDSDKITEDFKTANPFYKILATDVEIKLQRDRKSKANLPSYKMKIKPKKLDDEFQFYEQSHLIDYIESDYAKQNDYEIKNGEKIWLYETINRKIKNHIAGYLDDAYMLLTVEKHIVLNHFEAIAGDSRFDLNTHPHLPEYHFPFGSTNSNKKNDNKIAEMVFNEIDLKDNSFDSNDLINYRNNVFHQQLQSSKKIYTLIRKALTDYCIKQLLLIPAN